MLRTTTIAAALCTTAAAVNPHKAAMDSIAKAHQTSVDKLLKMAESAPRRPLGKGRRLATASYLNWAYYNAGGSCTSEGPYAYSGVSSEGCLTTSDGGNSYKGSCSGSQSAIDVEILVYNNGDCSGDADDSIDLVIDGSCAANPVLEDDSVTVDDRVADDDLAFIHNYVSATITCSSSRNTGTFRDQGIPLICPFLCT